MPKLIVVQGISNSGKSSAIEEFVTVHRAIYLKPFPPIIVVPIVKGHSIILGVGKNGDSAAQVLRTLDLFSSHHCDVVVCATKSSGASANALTTFIATNPAIAVVIIKSNWVGPYVAGTVTPAQASANSRLAALIESNIP